MFNFRSAYFLTDCYGKKFDENRVYNLFLRKVLYDKALSKKFMVTFENFLDILNEEYLLAPPQSFIEQTLKRLCEQYDEIHFADFNLIVDQLPTEIKKEIEAFGKKFNADSFSLRDSYNRFRNENGLADIKGPAFERLLNSISEAILDDSARNSLGTNEKTLIEWIVFIFERGSSEYRVLLNKALCALLVYQHFTNKSSGEVGRFASITFYLDTNVLAQLIGIHGKAKKKFVEEFIVFCRENDCKIKISHETLKELKGLIRAAPNIDIEMFKEASKEVCRLVATKPEAFFRSLFPSEEMVTFEKRFTDEVYKEFPYWDYLKNSLKEYKIERGRDPYDVDYSAEHDVHLVALSNAYQYIENIYEAPALIATTDYNLYKWLFLETKKKFDSPLPGIVTLDRICLLLWIEGKQTTNNEFLSKTWAYIAESLPFFKNNETNSVYRLMKERRANTQDVPGWRSYYILLENHLEEMALEDAEPSEIIEALSSITELREADYLKQINSLKAKSNRLAREKAAAERDLKRAGNQNNHMNDRLDYKDERLRIARQSEQELSDAKSHPLIWGIKNFLKRWRWVVSFLKLFGINL